MAGETYSLDFTPATEHDAQGNLLDSTTPLYPGYQVVSVVTARGDEVFQVRRVTLRIDARDAARGIAEETVTLPGNHATLEDAVAAAGAAFVKDGPGDAGRSQALQDATKAAVAQHAPAPAPEPVVAPAPQA